MILFLAANPGDTPRLALDEECAAIECELRMAPGRDDFDFRSKWAVGIDELMRHLNDHPPTIIHFSGHGGGRAGLEPLGRHNPPSPLRDVESIDDVGICLQGERRAAYVSERALTQMIASGAPTARVVVLNACFSDAMAESLCNVVDCVIGMSCAIGDAAARGFAAGFYRALGHHRSVGNAVAQAVATLVAKDLLPDQHRPTCRTRAGISADRIFLPTTDHRRP